MSNFYLTTFCDISVTVGLGVVHPTSKPSCLWFNKLKLFYIKNYKHISARCNCKKVRNIPGTTWESLANLHLDVYGVWPNRLYPPGSSLLYRIFILFKYSNWNCVVQIGAAEQQCKRGGEEPSQGHMHKINNKNSGKLMSFVNNIFLKTGQNRKRLDRTWDIREDQRDQIGLAPADC
jgi:hypothetical protein